MMFKKNQLVYHRVYKCHLSVRDATPNGEGRICCEVVVGYRKMTYRTFRDAIQQRVWVDPAALTLIGNNVQPLKPRDATNCRCVTKPMAGIPQRPTEEAPPRHGAVTDKLRELMNAVVSKDEQIRVLQNMYDDARTEMMMLRTQLTEANRKNKWWQL